MDGEGMDVEPYRPRMCSSWLWCSFQLCSLQREQRTEGARRWQPAAGSPAVQLLWLLLEVFAEAWHCCGSSVQICRAPGLKAKARSVQLCVLVQWLQSVLFCGGNSWLNSRPLGSQAVTLLLCCSSSRVMDSLKLKSPLRSLSPKSAVTSPGLRPGSSSHCTGEEEGRQLTPSIGSGCGCTGQLCSCLQVWERGGGAGCTSMLCRAHQHLSQLGFWGRSSCFSGLMCLSVCLCLSAAGCTFEEDDDLNQCEYSQGEDDDFGWELVRSYMMPHLTADLPHGESPPQIQGWSYAWDGICPWVDLVHLPSRGWDAAVPHGKV